MIGALVVSGIILTGLTIGVASKIIRYIKPRIERRNK